MGWLLGSAQRRPVISESLCKDRGPGTRKKIRQNNLAFEHFMSAKVTFVLSENNLKPYARGSANSTERKGIKGIIAPTQVGFPCRPCAA